MLPCPGAEVFRSRKTASLKQVCKCRISDKLWVAPSNTDDNTLEMKNAVPCELPFQAILPIQVATIKNQWIGQGILKSRRVLLKWQTAILQLFIISTERKAHLRIRPIILVSNKTDTAANFYPHVINVDRFSIIFHQKLMLLLAQNKVTYIYILLPFASSPTCSRLIA